MCFLGHVLSGGSASFLEQMLVCVIPRALSSVLSGYGACKCVSCLEHSCVCVPFLSGVLSGGVLPRALSSVLSGSCASVREHACVVMAHASACDRAQCHAAFMRVSFLEHSCVVMADASVCPS